jgi:ubiquinone/menaquinone biosynthesis C-methylase UbiE
MNSDKEVNDIKWGSKEWFDNLASTSNSASDYFSHDKNGYQKHRHRKLINFIKQNIQLNRPISILDVGCGEGHFTNILSQEFLTKNVTGFDFIECIINSAKEKYPHLTLLHQSLPNIPFKENAFDLVIASETLYYLNNIDRKKSLKNIFHSLNENGHLLFTSKLGNDYFNEIEDKKLFLDDYEIIKTDYLYNELYNKIMHIPRRIIRFNYYLNADHSPGSKKNILILNKYQSIFNNNFILKKCLFYASQSFNALLSSSLIPFIVASIAILFGDKFKSNIIILARKK